MTTANHIGKSIPVVIAGAGNVAWHFGHALLKAGIPVHQLYNRSERNGLALASEFQCRYINRTEDIDKQAFCILAVSDDAIYELVHTGVFKESPGVVHTAGTVPMNIFEGNARNYGVLYPLQTLTRGKEIDFSEVPILIESGQPGNLNLIRVIAEAVSNQVHTVSSDDRLIIHMAGVICSNFTNRLYAVSEQIMQEHRLPFAWLKPLILETAAKAVYMSPKKAQTGPAIRGNMDTINKHMALLRDKPDLLELYSLLTESIRNNK